MTWRKRRRGSAAVDALVDALVGAASGVAASWVMEKAQPWIMRRGSEAQKDREQRAQGDLEPATVQAARRAVKIVGRSLPEERKGTAGEVVHYLTGAAFGALYGALAPRVSRPTLAAGALFGAAVWLVNDEGLVPALGLSRRPWAYPVSSHVKALAAHLVYGAATDGGFRLLGAAVR